MDLPRKHVYVNAYLIVGSRKTLMVETGHAAQWDVICEQLDKVLGSRPLDYIFPTHQEIPHAGNLGRLLERYPQAVAVGEVRDYHLHFPAIERSRFVRKRPGDLIDLGDATFKVMPSLWHDLPSTLWGYTSPANVIFTVDALEYSHFHGCGHCGLVSCEIAETDMPESRIIGGFIGYIRMRPRIEAMHRWVDELHAVALAPSHGAPVVGNVPAALKKLLDEAARAGLDADDALVAVK
jgi:flavorubredoxin